MKVPILLPNIFNHPFTYDSDFKLRVGEYVVVPFGKSELTGVVWDEFEKKNNKNFAIKKVLRKLDVPPLKKKIIKFLNWFSGYNMIPRGMALKLLLLSSNAVEKISDKFYGGGIEINPTSEKNIEDLDYNTIVNLFETNGFILFRNFDINKNKLVKLTDLYTSKFC